MQEIMKFVRILTSIRLQSSTRGLFIIIVILALGKFVLFSGTVFDLCRRIYIKRVTKFPHYAVDLKMDKKNLKASMDTAFQALKDKTHKVLGHER